MDTEKTIRVLGYVLWAILWSPAIILIGVLTPILMLAFNLAMGWQMTPIQLLTGLYNLLRCGVEHDRYFIETGKWI